MSEVPPSLRNGEKDPCFEELTYYAGLQRTAELNAEYHHHAFYDSKIVSFLGFKRKPVPENVEIAQTVSERQEVEPTKYSSNEKNTSLTDISPHQSLSENPLEEILSADNIERDKINARRALRSATWVSVFYLITTDILGPSSAPYAISRLGFGPGIALYLVLGGVAVYTGFLLYYMFLGLDSLHFPVKSYGDLCLQLLCNVAVIILGNGQGLSQIINPDTVKLCFSVVVLVWALAGMIVGQIRTLKNFGWLANFAIWLNLFVCFATMGIVAHSSPNWSAAKQAGLEIGPIITRARELYPFYTQLQGVMNIVYAYGGAMLFCEFMAEMKRPMDFWKGMILAQIVISCIYMMFGTFVYAYQGQYVVNPANQGVNPYGWQTALNVINLVSALIAAGLYGNVGIKVLYETIIRPLTSAPELSTRMGKLLWIPIVIVYWGVAYIIAMAIPQFSSLTSLVGAICILQFSYTFPPIMYVGYIMQKDALDADHPYDAATGKPNRVDSWRNWSRWTRAYSRHWMLNTFNILLTLAALATAILGIYASIKSLIDAFAQNGATTSFSCTPPV
ncbi:hypothetical protein CANCADRAFT_4622 [Tortispora caseinolytica NRRL Y-17796]|uniref:Amino acid transporter transmembrane domain-containing protein n=1 Tax=Tortispora caseinolytica NRRL Y-17796 TaxID=767744 RepID=A0A1E4T9U8_9ASCO|nr:hypothetical protein CANCADRAFT_4622 [Tortispora caseinolytica NRRL Y-17796]